MLTYKFVKSFGVVAKEVNICFDKYLFFVKVKQMAHYSDYSDLELLAAIKKNSAQAFDALYNRHWQSLLQHAVNMLPSVEDAEEVVQNLFIKVWKNRETLEAENIENYLHAGVKYGCISLHRILLHEKKYREYCQLFLTSVSEPAETAWLEQERRELLEKAIIKLPAQSQEIIRMKFIEGMSFKEISEKLTLTTKTIEYKLSKSKRLLKTALQHLISLAVMARWFG